jgi:hypothetical protein
VVLPFLFEEEEIQNAVCNRLVQMMYIKKTFKKHSIIGKITKYSGKKSCSAGAYCL